jgi:hypothetical protein
MTWRGLLVSVRDAAEATAALAGGATIVDVKEPAHGPLGAADPQAIAGVAAIVGTRVPWTMACGELRAGAAGIVAHLERVQALLQAAPSAVPPAAVKVGLAGLAGGDWQAAVRGLWAALPAGPERVAVAYADWPVAAAPAPEDVIPLAASLGSSILLLDTFDKSGGGVLEWCPARRLADLMDAARSAGLRVAVAGRITMAEIPTISALGPEVVALRSAVCSNDGRGSGRLGTVQEDLVHRARRLIDGSGVGAPAGASSGVWQ